MSHPPRPLGTLMDDATRTVESGLDPHDAWSAGVRRRRRATGRVAVAAATAAVAAVAAVAVGVTNQRSSTPDPLPSPSMTPTGSPETDDQRAGAGYQVEPRHVLPVYDPTTWDQLPEFPTDLGWWAQADRILPLEESPVERATAVVQVMLGPDDGHLWIFGDDGRWRSVDDVDFELVDDGETFLGIGRGSLSADGTQLAIGQTDGVVVVDLTTAEQRTYPIRGLGDPWTGRQTFWAPDGSAVLVSQSYVYTTPEGDGAYQDGWRVDLGDGSVSRVPYDPAHTALFADGSKVVNHWTESVGHQWFLDDGDNRTEVDLDLSAVYEQGPVAHGQRWAAVRELTFLPEGELAWEASGVVVRDSDGRPLALLPVTGVENHGGGASVLGWADESTVLFAMPREGAVPHRGVVAWNVDTGQLFRGPLLLDNETVSVAAR